MSDSVRFDPINSAIYDGVKRGINVCLESECFGSAVILILSGIDTMANLSMPVGQVDVTRDDFVRWCDRYIRFRGSEQLTGLELYSARCGMLHTYTVESRLTRSGQCRKLVYMDRSVPEIRYSRRIDPSVALVSIEASQRRFLTASIASLSICLQIPREPKLRSSDFSNWSFRFPERKPHEVLLHGRPIMWRAAAFPRAPTPCRRTTADAPPTEWRWRNAPKRATGRSCHKNWFTHSPITVHDEQRTDKRVSSAPCAHYAAFWAGFSLGGAYGCGSEVVRVARCAV